MVATGTISVRDSGTSVPAKITFVIADQQICPFPTTGPEVAVAGSPGTKEVGSEQMEEGRTTTEWVVNLGDFSITFVEGMPVVTGLVTVIFTRQTVDSND